MKKKSHKMSLSTSTVAIIGLLLLSVGMLALLLWQNQMRPSTHAVMLTSTIQQPQLHQTVSKIQHVANVVDEQQQHNNNNSSTRRYRVV